MPKYVVLKGYTITQNNVNYHEGEVIEIAKADGDRLEKYGYIQSCSQKKGEEQAPKAGIDET